LADRFFSPKELRALRSRPTTEHVAHCFATWSHEEALDLLESGTEPAAAAADDAQSSRPDAELASS
jgi:hypothetical protein